jgi:hypothetical protein
MYKILEASCHNGDLILNEKLSATMEGKSFRVILLEESDIERKKQQFLELKFLIGQRCEPANL